MLSITTALYPSGNGYHTGKAERWADAYVAENAEGGLDWIMPINAWTR